MILGLTGSIGSGKSTVSDMLKKEGFEIFDADKIARELMESKEVKLQIKKAFGNFIFDENDNLDRKALKNIVFNKRDKLKILNSIIHPRVIGYYKNIANLKSKEIKIFDVPLLFETGIDKYCDKILVIDIDEDIQIERVMKRDTLDKELVKKIISSQSEREDRLSKADYIITNNSSLDELENNVKKLIEELKGKRI